jgi:hypothetical protein
MSLEEIVAAILYFSNYVLGVVAMYFCVVLFRRYRNIGWLVLGSSFLYPFVYLAMRIAAHRRLLTYRIVGTTSGGLASVTYNYEVPGFLILAVAALCLLARDTRGSNKA